MKAAFKRSFRTWLIPVLLFGVLEWYTRTLGASSDALASPSSALLAWWRAVLDGSLFASTAFTLGTAAFGLSLALVLGLTFGLLLGLSRRASGFGFLTIEVLRPIPSVALIPIAMLIFGFGVRFEASVVAFACTWPVLLQTQAAVRQIDPQLLELAANLEMGLWARIKSILLPALVARFFVALRLAIAIALVVAVTVEIAANPYGMGYALMLSQQSLAPDAMLAWLLWIGVVGFLLNNLTLKLQDFIDRRMGAKV
jgi:sulfonate transport system permease protein